jgi:hypothetical protein
MMMMMMMHLCCVGLNKCILFSNKYNGMASIKMANINLRKSQNYNLCHINNQSILKFNSSLLERTLTVIWTHTRTTKHPLFHGHVLLSTQKFLSGRIFTVNINVQVLINLLFLTASTYFNGTKIVKNIYTTLNTYRRANS